MARLIAAIATIALLSLGDLLPGGNTITVTAQAQEAKPDQLAYGKHLSQECTTCHRADTRSATIPPIVGLEVDYFVTTMKFYKSGARTNPVMNSVAATLSEEQLEALAAYLATQKPPAKPSASRRK